MMQQVESYQMLFNTLGYNRVLILDTGLGDREELHRRAGFLASMFNFSIDRAECDLVMFDRSYDLAKQRLKEGGTSEGCPALGTGRAGTAVRPYPTPSFPSQ
jgi:hypothetical protein